MVRRTDEELRDIKGQRCSNRQINGKTETSRQKKQKEKVGVSKQGVFVHAISRLKKKQICIFWMVPLSAFYADGHAIENVFVEKRPLLSSVRSFVRSFVHRVRISQFFCFFSFWTILNCPFPGISRNWT